MIFFICCSDLAAVHRFVNTNSSARPQHLGNVDCSALTFTFPLLNFCYVSGFSLSFSVHRRTVSRIGYYTVVRSLWQNLWGFINPSVYISVDRTDKWADSPELTVANMFMTPSPHPPFTNSLFTEGIKEGTTQLWRADYRRIAADILDHLSYLSHSQRYYDWSGKRLWNGEGGGGAVHVSLFLSFPFFFSSIIFFFTVFPSHSFIFFFTSKIFKSAV